MLVRTDTRDVKVNILPSWKEPTKRILKRRVEDKKKLTIPKIIHFEAYRPVVVINNDSKKNVQIQGTFLPTKNILRQSDALSSIIPTKKSEVATNKILKKEGEYPSIQ